MIFTRQVQTTLITLICQNLIKNCKCAFLWDVSYIIAPFFTALYRNFQNFDNSQPTAPPNYDINYANPNAGGGGAMGTFYDPTVYAPNPYEQDKQFKPTGGGAGNEFDDEPPLLEELGINPNHIFQKVKLLKYL